MKTALISLTENGRKITRKIADRSGGGLEVKRYAFEKHCDDSAVAFIGLKSLVSEIFTEFDALVFVASCGIAVRCCAPFISSKTTDPAVIVIDEQGKFTISLLSGHLGGANALAEYIAHQLGNTPVITTATDVGERFSPDSFAKANGLHICNMKLAKEAAARIVDGGKIGFISDVECINSPKNIFGNDSDMGIYVGRRLNYMPFEKTLCLVVRNVVIGVGCRKNVLAEEFEKFVLSCLDNNSIPLEAVFEIHTIDLKKSEAAILSFSEKYGIPIKLYSRDRLEKVDGEFSSSDFVRKTVGVDNVCERSAKADGGRIIVKKQAGNGMTFAAAEFDFKVDFERKIL